MIKYSQWLVENQIPSLIYEDEILVSQIDQLVTRLEGLLYGLTETQRTAIVDTFMKQVEERILGL